MSARTVVPLSDDVAEGDGRRLRRERNRQAAVDALLDLYRDGNLRPSAVDIAERAGLSPRSLFRYFDDVDDLSRAAVARQEERALPLLPVAAEAGAPRRSRIDALAAQRFRLFDAVAAAATVSRMRAPFTPTLAAVLAQNRAYLREQVRKLFAVELSAMEDARAVEVLAAADVLTSFEAHQLLRHDHEFGVERARAVMAGALDALFAAEDGPSVRTAR